MRRILLVLTVAAITATMMVFSAVPAFARTFDSPPFTSGDRIGGSSATCDFTLCQGGAGGFLPSTCNEAGECFSYPGGSGFRTTNNPEGTDETLVGGGGGLLPTGDTAENGQPELAGGGAGRNCNTGVEGCVGTGLTGGPA